MMLQLAILLYTLNSVILSILSIIYARTAIKTRAAYPISLLFFSLLLLLHSAGTAIAYFTLSPYFGDEAMPFMSIVGAFELLGLLALLKVTI